MVWTMRQLRANLSTCGLLGCAVVVLAAFLAPSLAQAAAGDLDPSFGTGGKVTTDFGGDVQGEIVSTAIDSRGRIVAGGFSGDIHSRGYFTLARYLPDGSLDRSFGTGGIAVTGLEGTAFSVAIDRVGRIVAAGSARGAPAGSDLAVARYHSDGSPDTSFGTGGVVTTDFGGDEWARSVAIDSRGRIVAMDRGASVEAGSCSRATRRTDPSTHHSPATARRSRASGFAPALPRG
jgi:uncharacterized delta-60 repeat protein